MKSIRLRLILLFVVVTTTTLGAFAYYEQRLLRHDLENRFVALQRDIASRLQQDLAQPLWDMDLGVVNAKLEAALIPHEVQAVYLYVPDQKEALAGLARNLSGSDLPSRAPDQLEDEMRQVLIFPPPQVDPARRKISIGRVSVYFSRAGLEQALSVAMLRRLVEVLVANILLLMVLFFSLRLVFVPLSSLRNALHDLASNQAEDLQALPRTQLLEFDQVVEGFNATLGKVKTVIARHRQAEAAALEASQRTQEALGQVRLAQQELLESNRQLERLTVTDSLTGLGNRMMLDRVLEEQLNRYRRYGGVFSLVLLDIDFFKRINDTHGHPVGDMVLVALAQLLKQSTRSVDVIGRWGGEEFLLICPDTDLFSALELAEKLRQRVESCHFPIIDALSASFGVASVQEDDNAQSLLARVDRALYRAKDGGRNRVVGESASA
ncbi:MULTISPECIES: sensor domain-containing diguanylate cyclase [unclassified Paludibacterium]|uniref:sensor domain-containing diguanylate cyclase n=1 Tax=unclassified Paludibacterium TaxID=2618429 RepID=UPI001C05698A|nr:sensor domain-containing diguanylate cyclase [Paludibacterium sp. B53371]BEV72570.1 hypothetical protein THUN1379_20520 [Paludibacterium sp. THUN1379]